MTVPVDCEPPGTDAGASVTLERVAPVSVNDAVFWAAPMAAVRVTVSVAFTRLLLTVNIADVAPDGTTTI